MILTASSIRALMALQFPHKLVITPLLDRVKQLETGAAAVDLRLGQEIMTADPAVLACMDPLGREEHGGPESHERGQDCHSTQAHDVEALQGYLTKTCLPLGGEFILHPRQFALAATLEYIRLPDGVAGHVVGRSRWARVGLIIAMATFVHPGYAGCLTLELQNLGDVPMQLSPGFTVAQLILEDAVRDRGADASQRTCAIGPEFLGLLSDKERCRLRQLRTRYRTLTGDKGWPELLNLEQQSAARDSQSQDSALPQPPGPQPDPSDSQP